jgi:hypothetical protein
MRKEGANAILAGLMITCPYYHTGILAALKPQSVRIVTFFVLYSQCEFFPCFC